MDIIKQLSLLKQVYSERGVFDTDHFVYRIPKSITKSDLEALKIDRHTPNNFIEVDHDAIISNLKELTSSWTLEEAASTFIAGLWSAPFYWRSALLAKLIATSMPEHVYTPYSDTSLICTICGFEKKSADLTSVWYTGFTDGVPLDGEPINYVLHLQEMTKTVQKPKPTSFDCWTFRALLTMIRNLPPKTRYSKLRDILKKESLLPTKNAWAYGSLLESLALIGILDTPERPGMVTKYTTYKERDQRPNNRVEVQAPLAWWDSSIGINEKTLNKIFSSFDCSSINLLDRPEPQPLAIETIIGMLDRIKPPRTSTSTKSKTAGEGTIEAGDVYAIRIRDGVWITAFCHEVETTRSLYAKMEYLEGIFEEMPTEDQLQSAFIGRRDGRWQQWTSAMDKTSWVRRITRNFTTPKSNKPEPDRISSSGAKDLIRLADWCFIELREL